MDEKFMLFLNLFDGGDAGADTGATSGAAGQNSVVEGSADGNNEDEATRRAKYKEFVSQYKDLDDERVQKIVTSRLRSSKAEVDRYKAMDPIMNALAQKYGVAAGDHDAIMRAITEDEAYLDEQADMEGLTREQQRELNRLRSEQATRTMQEQAEEQSRQIEAIQQRWESESDALREIYPDFDFETEVENEEFADLLKSGIPVRTAFEVVHHDDIISGAMQYAVQTATDKVVNSIRAHGRRPLENGASSQAAAATKFDVSKMTVKQAEELERRAARGERITLR